MADLLLMLIAITAAMLPRQVASSQEQSLENVVSDESPAAADVDSRRIRDEHDQHVADHCAETVAD